MKNNLFSYATSELSQDAFICWLFSYALKDAKKDVGLRRCAIDFINDFVPILFDFPDDEIFVTKITRQYAKIDVLLEINEKYYVIIEDKTYTADHDNQLIRYREQLISDGIPESYIFCIYFKTGFEANSNNVLSAGYAVFDRKQILKILNMNSAGIDNDIFCDYLNYLETLESDSQKYKVLPVSEWDWKAILGYYDDLIRDKSFSTNVMDGEFSYDYIANQSGGFYGAWLFQSKPIISGSLEFYPYIQMEFKDSAINICARLSVEKHSETFNATKLKDCIAYHDTIKWQYDLEQFGFFKPNRLAPGKTMSVGKVWKTDRSDILYQELTDSLQRVVSSFDHFISYCKEKADKEAW